MKKTLAICTLALLLCGCGEPVGMPEGCINTPNYAQIGETVYMDYAASLRAFNSMFPEGRSLCYDPLCSHSGEDFCPEMLHVDHVVTDGERIYAKTGDGEGAAIWSMKPDGGELRRLVTYPRVDGLVTGFSTDGGYLYYVEGHYKENRDGDSYGIPMRIPCDGGEAERLTEGEFSAYAEIYADAAHYYITDSGMLYVIDRESMEEERLQMPTAEIYGVILHGGEVYLYGAQEIHEYEINSRFLFFRNAVWRLDGNSFEPVIESAQELVFDAGGIWYIPMLPEPEFELVGTKEFPDGSGGASPYDFIRTHSGELVYHDLAGGEEKFYTFDNIYLKAELLGVSDGYVIATCNDLSELNFNYTKNNLKPEADGSLSLLGALREEGERAE